MSNSYIRAYMTGATSPDATQDDLGLSLGGYLSSTPADSYTALPDAATWFRGVTVVDVAGAIDETIIVEAVTANQLRMKLESDSTWGAAVTLATGATETLAGADAAHWIIVSRASDAPDLSGRSSIALTVPMEGAWGGPELAVGGAAVYRCMMLVNSSAADVVINLESTGVQFGIADVDSTFQTRDGGILAEGTAPSWVTFANDTATPTTIPAGHAVAIWLMWWAGLDPANPETTATIEGSLDGVSVDWIWRGRGRIGNSALSGLELYRGVDAAPNLAAAPWETPASLPHLTAALDPGHTYHFVTRQRNRWNQVSQNTTATIIDIDALGVRTDGLPSGPEAITLTALSGGGVRVEATYDWMADGSLAADTWLLWAAVGADPDPDVDTPDITRGIAGRGARAVLATVLTGYTAGDVVHVIVRLQRSSDDATSTNATAATVTALGLLAAPDVVAWPGYTAAAPETIWSYDASNYIEADPARGTWRVVLAGVTIAAITRGNVLRLKGEIIETARTSNVAQAAAFAMSGTNLSIGVGGYRVGYFSTAGNLYIGMFIEDSTYPATGWAAAPAWWADAGTILTVTTDQATAALGIERTNTGTFQSTIYLHDLRELDL